MDPINNIITLDNKVGASLHVYDWTDRFIIIFVAVVIFFQQISQTLAFRYEKVGRIAPMYYIQVIFCCIVDIWLFGTVLGFYQVLGGLIVIMSNITIAVLKCLEIIK